MRKRDAPASGTATTWTEEFLCDINPKGEVPVLIPVERTQNSPGATPDSLTSLTSSRIDILADYQMTRKKLPRG